MRLRLETLLLIGIAAATGLAGCAQAAPPQKTARAAQSARAGATGRSGLSGSYVRASGDRFEIVTAGVARPVFFRGVNLGAGAPGRFPGEFAFTKDDYRRYLRFARDLHANSIRLYALHPPAFYQALHEENAAHPDRPLWLFQEVWTELPDSDDFWDRGFTAAFDAEIRNAVDALHGNALLPPRPGHASGRYDADVSPWIAGWLLGREWEPYAVRVTEKRNPGRTAFQGTFFTVDDGTAMEAWLARTCDAAAAYETSRYGEAHALSFVNWPTLDPMRHPTETERGGREAEHDEDAYSVDPTRIRPVRNAATDPAFHGYFANYHVYPYYPDFMDLDPGYNAFRDRHGPCAYAGYLHDLKAHTRGIPLLIGEYGVPTSRGIAHVQPQGIDHGGASEREQGERDVRLLQDIAESGCAGSLLFALFDEWFKVNWLVAKLESPRDRDPLWHNLLDPEECYGLIAFDPPPKIRVDGATGDWSGVAPYASDPRGKWIRAFYATSDQDRVYLRFDVDPKAPGGPPAALGAAIDVLDPARGDTRLPAPLRAVWSRGAEYAFVITPGKGEAGGRAELFIDARTNWSGWSRLLERGAFVGNRAPFRPVANDDGRYVPLLIETNRERVARDGTVYPARHLDWGRLSFGREHAPAGAVPRDSSVAYDPHAEWFWDRARGVIEVAIPWGLIGVSDPSSRSVLDDVPGTSAMEATKTAGIGFLAWATSASGFAADSLGPSRPGARPARPPECQFLGPSGTIEDMAGQEVRIRTPEAASMLWNAWETPITRERAKESAALVREAFEGMEARETEASRDVRR
ncbi:MAG: hypothetical protein ACM3PF_00495 [Bacteroidota bacterium]